MNIEIKPHTILLMVGPDSCGKTTFAKDIIMSKLEDKVKVSYVSSDELRADLLGIKVEDVENKESQMMMEMSGQAFDLLYNKVKAYTSFPVNSEVVIVDTKGLSERFREDMIDIGRENNYNVDLVLFNYKDMSDYYKDIDSNKRVVEGNVRRLRRKVLSELSVRKYNNIHTVREKDFLENPDKYEVFIKDFDLYKEHFLPEDNDYLIVGDVHEQLDDLKNLLNESGFIIEDGKIIGNDYGENNRIILLGDFIDKGNNTEEIINFIYDNKDWFYLVKGNHENFVGKVLKGIVDKTNVDDSALVHFSSLGVLENNEILADKFLELYEGSKEFYRYMGDKSSSFYVTHAPCEKKYLGKVDGKSLSRQLNFRISYENEGTKAYVEELEESLNFLKEDNGLNTPFHIFGHIATGREYRVGNSVGLDTGAVYGNRLTGVIVGYGRVLFKSVKSLTDKKQLLPEVFKRKLKKVDLSTLDRFELRKLRFAARNKINFISGTMSPSDKDVENNVLESLEKGLDYYKNNGVGKVILQPKYMGSRCNIYLFKDIDKSFAVSRNGFIIRRVDLSGVYNKLHERYIDYMDKENINIIILDGELLPWSVLGKGLIEDSFKPLSEISKYEFDLLEKYGFEKHLNKVTNEMLESDYDTDKNILNKKDMVSKYGRKSYEDYRSLDGYEHTGIEESREMLSIYEKQLDMFGNVDKDVYFEGFNVLKMVDVDGNNVFYKGDNEEIFNFVSDNDYVVVDLDEEGYEKARIFYDSLTIDKGMEGVVLKPLENVEGVLPFMKVRNEEYLTLVYGYDYTVEEKYNRLVKQKNIRRKVKTSLKEHELGKKMLNIRYDDISEDNDEYMQLIANMILEIRGESSIDPRL